MSLSEISNDFLLNIESGKFETKSQIDFSKLLNTNPLTEVTEENLMNLDENNNNK